MRNGWWAAAFALAFAAPAAAQHEHGAGGTSEIKALTAEQMHGYMTGEGMGMALAAELNHYPGPKHVLELADSLAITAAQRTEVEAIRQRMLDRAVALTRRARWGMRVPPESGSVHPARRRGPCPRPPGGISGPRSSART